MCDYIEANLDGRPVAGAASPTAVELRPHRLAHATSAIGTGVPLHQYVLGRRVERAAGRLLRSSDDPIAAIAIDCGFADQSHLTTAFRRRVGITPAAYRSA